MENKSTGNNIATTFAEDTGWYCIDRSGLRKRLGKKDLISCAVFNLLKDDKKL